MRLQILPGPYGWLNLDDSAGPRGSPRLRRRETTSGPARGCEIERGRAAGPSRDQGVGLARVEL